MPRRHDQLTPIDDPTGDARFVMVNDTQTSPASTLSPKFETFATAAEIAERVRRDGDSMTGPLAVLAPTQDAHPARKDGLDAVDAKADSAQSTANVALSTATSAQSTADAAVAKSGDTMTGPLVLPSNSAVLEAAQITAWNPATGQVAIGGHEIGDTGWKDVLGSLVNGYTAFEFSVRRVGYVVEMELVNLTAPDLTFQQFADHTLGLQGFQPSSDQAFTVRAGNPSKADYRLLPWRNLWRAAPTDLAAASFNVTWTTEEAWPT